MAGTDYGVFLLDRKSKDGSSKPRRVLDLRSVTQIDVLEQHAILLVLTDKNLYSYSTDVLGPDDSGPLSARSRGRKISGANFFKIGVFDGQHLVCCVKTSALSATIKVFKPMDAMANNKKKSGLAKMMSGGQEVLRPHKVSTSLSPNSLIEDVADDDYRNFTYPPKHTRYTFFALHSALVARGASK